MNKRRIISGLLTIVVAAVAVVAGTTAYFSDTETSAGNRFQAGALDLKIDSEAHYNGLVCRQVGSEGSYFWLHPGVGEPDPLNPLASQEHYGVQCFSTWSERNLTTADKFFNFGDLKPGDKGENTISLHVYDNDAWGRFRVHNLLSKDNSCTEPEIGDEPDCATDLASETDENGTGELHSYLRFSAWLDQGSIPGFQCQGVARCTADPLEGDNIFNGVERYFWEDQPATENTWNIWELLAFEYARDYTVDCTVVNGNTNYGNCHGLAQDGRMVGSTTYYFGLEWSLPTSVGNIVQTDSLTADMSFDIVQWRNNPGPSPIGFPAP